MTAIRVISYNIHKGRSATGTRESLEDLRLSLYNLAPDLLFLQEVQGRNERDANLDAQHESLAAVLGMYTAYGCNAMRQHTDHGNALLSRYPILQYENQDVSDHRLEQRGLLHAVVEIKDRPVHCIVVHLGLFAGGRERQAQALVERIKSLVPAHEPLIIAGDFNDWKNRLSPVLIEELDLYEVFSFAARGPQERFRRSRLFRWWQPAFASELASPQIPQLGVGRGARLTPPPRTFPAVFPWLRLDRIYQRGFAVRSARVLQGIPWRQISDHAPLFTELELP
ncbi:MAG TPA: endonuclease/exonuclease/phosphatase family protein [Paenalcaligenes sp.]|nr:endonuclease/exonuclease/phosphatase family protein [Paenalcaligenes sp.]